MKFQGFHPSPLPYTHIHINKIENNMIEQIYILDKSIHFQVSTTLYDGSL